MQCGSEQQGTREAGVHRLHRLRIQPVCGRGGQEGGPVIGSRPYVDAPLHRLQPVHELLRGGAPRGIQAKALQQQVGNPLQTATGSSDTDGSAGKQHM